MKVPSEEFPDLVTAMSSHFSREHLLDLVVGEAKLFHPRIQEKVIMFDFDAEKMLLFSNGISRRLFEMFLCFPKSENRKKWVSIDDYNNWMLVLKGHLI